MRIFCFFLDCRWRLIIERFSEDELKLKKESFLWQCTRGKDTKVPRFYQGE